MAITAAQVKELRERTGAGMMECKKALTETSGDMEAAIEYLRKAGLAKATKKAGRTAAEGRIALAGSGDRAVMIEVNCETDFVAKDDSFQKFVERLVQRANEEAAGSVDELLGLDAGDGSSLEQHRQALVAKLGENIQVRRMVSIDTSGATVGRYLHGNRIGVVAVLEQGDEELARDVAMHIAAQNPGYVGKDDVPAEVLEKEREILRAQAAESGKPPEIIEKMVEGRVQKFLAEITLLGQPFVKDPDLTVGKLADQKDAKVRSFYRMEVGEGIEREESDFAAEVMAQAGLTNKEQDGNA